MNLITVLDFDTYKHNELSFKENLKTNPYYCLNYLNNSNSDEQFTLFLSINWKKICKKINKFYMGSINDEYAYIKRVELLKVYNIYLMNTNYNFKLFNDILKDTRLLMFVSSIIKSKFNTCYFCNIQYKNKLKPFITNVNPLKWDYNTVNGICDYCTIFLKTLFKNKDKYYTQHNSSLGQKDIFMYYIIYLMCFKKMPDPTDIDINLTNGNTIYFPTIALGNMLLKTKGCPAEQFSRNTTH